MDGERTARERGEDLNIQELFGAQYDRAAAQALNVGKRSDRPKSYTVRICALVARLDRMRCQPGIRFSKHQMWSCFMFVAVWQKWAEMQLTE